MADTSFIFAPPDSKKSLTARRVHLHRLYDILQLSLQRNDIPRARRAWAIFSRCKEVDWKTMWTTGVHLLGMGMDDTLDRPERIDFLRAMMLQCPAERESILKELALRLIMGGKYREALDELETYLPSFPFQENVALHIYAGLICLYLGQPSAAQTISSFNLARLREAQTHLERARSLDADNIVAIAFLEKLQRPPDSRHPDHDSDDDNMVVDAADQRRKRART
ncbi:hypothetical protein PLICRDRAFT_47951 [Plicaturopsis crispa FD-325 SS-3]|nr:hypothetical protein PLICRDRAFT_47951 [Plicaturopsis crispa FD-325 SS-3]